MKGREFAKRLGKWVLALGALAFVAYVVPIRDHCVDPGLSGAAITDAPRSSRVSVSRAPDGCTLHRAGGNVPLDAAACARLSCEQGLQSTFAHVRLVPLGILLTVYLMSTLVWSMRWRALLRLAGVRISLPSTWRVTLEAQAGGVLLPGGVGGDALRVASIVERGGSLVIALASVFLDRIVGLAVMTSLAVLLVVLFGYAEVSRGVLLFLTCFPLGFIVGWPILRIRWLREIRWLPKSLRPVLEYAAEPHATRVVGQSALLSVLVSGTQFVVVRGLLWAIGYREPVSESGIVVGTAMAFIVAAIPALPGGWGTGDAAYVYFLGRAGVPPGPAFAVCLLYRLFWYLSAGLGALLLVVRPKKQKS